MYTSPWTGIKPTTLVVIGTDCIGSYKSNYHTITTPLPSDSVFYTPRIFALILHNYPIRTLYLLDMTLIWLDIFLVGTQHIYLYFLWGRGLVISHWNELLNLLVRIKFLNLFYIYLNKNWKNYWSERSFTGLGPEDRHSSWGLGNLDIDH
jgi:hypothetical protein